MDLFPIWYRSHSKFLTAWVSLSLSEVSTPHDSDLRGIWRVASPLLCRDFLIFLHYHSLPYCGLCCRDLGPYKKYTLVVGPGRNSGWSLSLLFMSPLKKAQSSTSILQSQLRGFCWPPLSVSPRLCFWLSTELFSWGALEEVAAVSSVLQFSSFPLPGSKHQEILFAACTLLHLKKKKKKASPWPELRCLVYTWQHLVRVRHPGLETSPLAACCSDRGRFQREQPAMQPSCLPRRHAALLPLSAEGRSGPGGYPMRPAIGDAPLPLQLPSAPDAAWSTSVAGGSPVRGWCCGFAAMPSHRIRVTSLEVLGFFFPPPLVMRLYPLPN